MWDNILSSVMEGKVGEAGRLFEESAKSFIDRTLSSPTTTTTKTKTTTTTTKKSGTTSSVCSISDVTVPVDNTSATAAFAARPKFLEAAKKGNKDEVKRLVEAGANLDTRDSNGMCALHLAAWNGHTEIVLYLLSKGASPQARSKQGSTPVHAASEKGFTEIVRLLLEFEESSAAGMISVNEKQPSEDESRKQQKCEF